MAFSHILVRDSDSVLTEMAGGAFPSVPAGHTQYEPVAFNQTPEKPVRYDPAANTVEDDTAGAAYLSWKAERQTDLRRKMIVEAEKLIASERAATDTALDFSTEITACNAVIAALVTEHNAL